MVLRPDAPHRANIRRSFGAVLILPVILSVASCTTPRVYETPANTAPPAADTVNLNTATAAELERLPRVGPKTAESIIRFRTDNGPFRHVEELMQVHGISESKFLEIRPYIRTE
jgi:competence ComEA-like helix-hairpin-helix protein